MTHELEILEIVCHWTHTLRLYLLVSFWLLSGPSCFLFLPICALWGFCFPYDASVHSKSF